MRDLIRWPTRRCRLKRTIEHGGQVLVLLLQLHERRGEDVEPARLNERFAGQPHEPIQALSRDANDRFGARNLSRWFLLDSRIENGCLRFRGTFDVRDSNWRRGRLKRRGNLAQRLRGGFHPSWKRLGLDGNGPGQNVDRMPQPSDGLAGIRASRHSNRTEKIRERGQRRRDRWTLHE